jgi:hypothetical protein
MDLNELIREVRLYAAVSADGAFEGTRINAIRY